MSTSTGTVPLSSVIHQLIERSYTQLLKVKDKCVRLNDADRKKELRKYFKTVRIQFIRLYILLQWVKELPLELKASLEQQERHFVDATARLVWLQREFLADAKVPIFDVPTAIEVLGTGTYKRLPSAMEKPYEYIGEEEPPTVVSEEAKEKAKLKLNSIIQAQLLSVRIPRQLVVSRIEGGCLFLLAKDEFEAGLTLLDGTRDNIAWTIVYLRVFVAPNGSPNYVGRMQIEEVKRLAQDALVKARLPLVEMYNVIHNFCCSMQLNMLQNQANSLRQLKSASSITKTTFQQDVLTIHYWRNPEITGPSPQAALGASPHPYLRFSIARSGLQGTHYPELLDPDTKQRIDLSFNPRHTNLEAVLVKARNHYSFHLIKALHNKIKQQLEQSILKPFVTTELQASEDLSTSCVVIHMCDGLSAQVGIEAHTGRLMLTSSIPDCIDILREYQIKLNDALDQSLHPFLVTLYRKAVLANYTQLAITNGMKKSQCNTLQLPQELVTMLNASGVACFQYVEDELDNYYIVVSVFSGPSPAPETQFFIISMRPDTPTSAKLQLHNIFRITSLPDGSLQFPNITSEALAEALNTNNASSLLVPKQVPRPDLTAAQLSPDYLISPILSPYTPNSATSVNGTTDAGSKKRKREQDESSPDEKSPEAKRVKLSDQKERKNNFTFATIIATCRLKLYRLLVQEDLKESGITYESSLSSSNPSRAVSNLLLTNLNYDPLIINQCILSILPNRTCIVSILESQPDIPEPKLLVTDAMDDRVISYEHTKHKWVLHYNKIGRRTVRNVLSDLQGLAMIVRLARQYFRYMTDPRYAEFFTARSVSASKLTIQFGKEKDASVVIQWNRAKRTLELAFSPSPYLLEQHISHELNTRKDIGILLDTLINSHTALKALRGFLSEGEVRISDFCVVPTDISTVKLLFRPTQPMSTKYNQADSYCRIVLEMRFVGNGIIALSDDAFRHAVSHVIKSKKAHPLIGFDKFSEWAAQRISNPSHATDQTLNIVVAREVTYVPEDLIGPFLRLLYPYLPSLCMAFSVAPPSTSDEFFPVSITSNPQFKAELILTPNFTLGLQVINISEPPAFTNEECELLAQFFSSKVMASPYRIVTLSCVQALLTAPVPLIKDVLRIYAELERQRAVPGVTVEIPLTSAKVNRVLYYNRAPVQRLVIHDVAGDGDLNIVVSFTRGAASLHFPLGLKHKQQPPKVVLWASSPAGPTREEVVFQQSNASFCQSLYDACVAIARFLAAE